ncbi:MAG TPA: PilX N-terminal domain-containing pilus assembly protein [Geomonas sp.]|nr:PilX N-terminal domain-containing pilus assembly protein [Geomonas sp.]
MAASGNQRGAALVTALMLTVLSLVISMTLLYSVTVGTRVSASQKRYRSALTAAQGGVEFLGDLLPRLFKGEPQNQLQNEFSLINLQLPQYACLSQKLDTPTAGWTVCSAGQASSDPGISPDATFRLKGEGREAGNFRVSTKIVDTVPGNSDKSGIDYLDSGGSVAAKDEIIHPRHVPAIYNLSVQGVREGGTDQEKARLSVLYAY